MRYFIIAGEQSGDLHGSNLVRELFVADRNAEIFCWGGDLMETAGATLLMHYRNTAFMGFLIILKNLRTISANFKMCKKQISEIRPDVIIFIDYPEFNLRIAKYAKASGFRTYYYISPKFWAWYESRVEKIRKYIDRMYIIFPFEVEFYQKHNIRAEFHGNPLVDETNRVIALLPGKHEILKSFNAEDKPVIGILAGSRRQEVEAMLPQMIQVVKYFPQYQFILAGVKNLPDELYRGLIGKEQVKLIKERTYEILSVCEAALVASGTASLEAALFNVPQVVCYKGDLFSMLIAWVLIKVKYISLVNLIKDSEVVKELLGYNVNKRRLITELKSILPGGMRREQILAGYIQVREKLGLPGASARVAKDIVENLRSI